MSAGRSGDLLSRAASAAVYREAQLGVQLALVDVEGTLVRGDASLLALAELWSRGWRRGRLAAFLAGALAWHLLRKMGAADRAREQEYWARGMARLLAGAAGPETRELFRAACARVRRRFRAGLLEELAEHRRAGRRVVLASAVVEPLLAEIAAAAGADAWIGTPLAVEGGRFTGELAGPVCGGLQKIRYVDELAARWGEAVDWAGSYAYSDGVCDLPVLERVGHPVAVNPDRRLAAVARRRSWRVLY